MSPRIYLSATILLLVAIVYNFGAFANVDMGYDHRACSDEKYFVQDVTNGKCYGVIIGR